MLFIVDKNNVFAYVIVCRNCSLKTFDVLILSDYAVCRSIINRLYTLDLVQLLKIVKIFWRRYLFIIVWVKTAWITTENIMNKKAVWTAHFISIMIKFSFFLFIISSTCRRSRLLVCNEHIIVKLIEKAR